MAMHYTQPRHLPPQQHGAALIVALVILAIVTLLGISSMTSTQIETRGAAVVASDSKLRQAAGSMTQRLLRAPPSGDNPIPLLTDKVDLELTDDDWQKVDKDRTDKRNWPLPDDCGSGRWRMRRLHPLGDAAGNTESYEYFELEVECYQNKDVVLATGLLDANKESGPLSRVISGMRIAN